MNALRNTASTTSKMFMTRRFASTYRPKSIDFTNLEKKIWNVKKDWLSDPSTYPIMIILGCAVTFMTGAGLHAFTYKDVTIDPAKRNSKLQTWGNEESHTVLERVISWNAYGKEGLGIDHEQWLKEKEASRSH
mmetsp:Transcript_20285/g.29009  ORF Transcript_20285/g.29009 Transcript_20285/m.29009 type:complete len:133 (-) Transcript_20285:145-543(-)